MEDMSKFFEVEKKLACVTLDFELDYGDRVNQFNIINKKEKLQELADLFSRMGIPVSTFIRTDILTNYPQSIKIIRRLSEDYHSHSHTHNTKKLNNETEISRSVSTFKKCFGFKPIGYRAPQGIFKNEVLRLIKKHGFKFSSSIFPSYRPGKFNNLNVRTCPFTYENGIVEIPFSVIPYIRYIISLSYLKMLGTKASNTLFKIFGLPDLIIFDSHLHDYIFDEKSFEKLPFHLKMTWGRNKRSGMKIFENFINILKDKEYEFITMTELYGRILGRAK